jgi:hypothetical protein
MLELVKIIFLANLGKLHPPKKQTREGLQGCGNGMKKGNLFGVPGNSSAK